MMKNKVAPEISPEVSPVINPEVSPETINPPQVNFELLEEPNKPNNSFTLEDPELILKNTKFLPEFVKTGCRLLKERGFNSFNNLNSPLKSPKDNKEVSIEDLIVYLLRENDKDLEIFARYLIQNIRNPSKIGPKIYFGLQYFELKGE